MAWKGRVNRALGRATGLELRRVRPRAAPRRPAKPRVRSDATAERLLERPVFIMAPIRSGSTLLRVLLDSHSQFHAPHELHLGHLEVREKSRYVRRAMRELGLEREDLEYLLWDRVLDLGLQRSGKRYLVNKTPNDLFVWQRIVECWPDVRFVFLMRHPLSIMRSREAARPQDPPERHIEMVLRYGNALEEARREHGGFETRYEDLTADPESVTRRLCDFLGVEWEAQMLDYGKFEHGQFRSGLGDWGEAIRSGRILGPRPLPPAEEVPEPLWELCAAWGYPAPGSTGGTGAPPVATAG